LLNNRQFSAGSTLDNFEKDVELVNQRWSKLRPWISSRSSRTSVTVPSSGSRVYIVESSYDHGDTTAYFDGITTNIFHENQIQRID